MKWFRNRLMLEETLERNNKTIEKTTSNKTKYLLKDYNNVIQDHLVLLDENEKFKALLDLISACGVDEEDRPKFYKLWDEIENDLERLEVLEKNSDKVVKDSVKLINKNLDLQQENEKLKKAIYIVYMKTVDLELLKGCFELKNGLKIYNSKVCFLQELVELEYNLLKEVLGNA